MSGFEVLSSGIFTLLQDRGRYGFTHLGVTNSGYLDEYTALFMQQLLNNKPNTNILEIAFSNVVLKSTANTTISVGGAFCDFFINDIEKPIWQTHSIKVGDIIKIGKILKGQRVYLSVKDGFNIPKEFGSNATTIKEKIGGITGHQIKKNDFLPFKDHNINFIKRLKEEFIPKYDEEVLTLRVVLSYQEDSFSYSEKEKFFNSIYTITNDFNRMACKLSGEAVESSMDGIISEGISFGAIQIPKDGQPIILLKERQTIGGYPKIGSVLNIDCFKLAQRKVASKVKFEVISIDDAQKKSKAFYSLFNH